LQRLKTHNGIEEIACLSDLRTNFGIGVLAKRNWWIVTLMHVLLDVYQEEVRSEERSLLGRFDISFVNRVLVVVFLSTCGPPSLH